MTNLYLKRGLITIFGLLLSTATFNRVFAETAASDYSLEIKDGHSGISLDWNTELNNRPYYVDPQSCGLSLSYDELGLNIVAVPSIEPKGQKSPLERISPVSSSDGYANFTSRADLKNILSVLPVKSELRIYFNYDCNRGAVSGKKELIIRRVSSDNSVDRNKSVKANSSRESLKSNPIIPSGLNAQKISVAAKTEVSGEGVVLSWQSKNASACRVWDSYSQKTRYKLPAIGSVKIGNGACGISSDLHYSVRCFDNLGSSDMFLDGTTLGGSVSGSVNVQSCGNLALSLKPEIKKLNAQESNDGQSLSINWETNHLNSCRLNVQCPALGNFTRFGGGSGSESFDISNLKSGDTCLYELRCFEGLTEAKDLSRYGGVNLSQSLTLKKSSESGNGLVAPLIKSTAGSYGNEVLTVSLDTQGVSGKACRVWFSGTDEVIRSETKADFNISKISFGNYGYNVCCYPDEKSYSNSGSCLSTGGVSSDGWVNIPKRPSEAKIDASIGLTGQSSLPSLADQSVGVEAERISFDKSKCGLCGVNASGYGCAASPIAFTRCSSRNIYQSVRFYACPESDDPLNHPILNNPNYPIQQISDVSSSVCSDLYRPQSSRPQNYLIGSVSRFGDVLFNYFGKILFDRDYSL